MPFSTKRVIYLDETTSTMTEAKKLWEKEKENALNTVIVARIQSAGRGREGRSWQSPEGGLYFTILLRPRVDLEYLNMLGVMIGLDLARFFEKLGYVVKVKWPNDLLLEGKKVGGILMESDFTGSNLNYLLIGIGLNTNSLIKNFHDDLKETITTFREKSGLIMNNNQLLKDLLIEIGKTVNNLEKKNMMNYLEEWKNMSITWNKPVKLYSLDGKEVLEGIETGITHLGEILVDVKSLGHKCAFNTGEIRLRTR